MLSEYIKGAMQQATYKQLEDGSFFGEISGFDGVYGNAASLEAARDDLQEALEEWLVLGLQHGHPLPVVNGIMLALSEQEA